MLVGTSERREGAVRDERGRGSSQYSWRACAVALTVWERRARCLSATRESERTESEGDGSEARGFASVCRVAGE